MTFFLQRCAVGIPEAGGGCWGFEQLLEAALDQLEVPGPAEAAVLATAMARVRLRDLGTWTALAELALGEWYKYTPGARAMGGEISPVFVDCFCIVVEFLFGTACLQTAMR